MVGIKLCKSLALAFVFFAATTKAEVMFEGYAKIKAPGGKQIGYIVSKYDFDAKSKKFTSTYLMRTETEGGDITESLKAFSNDKMQPLSYSYTSIVGKVSKTIDAKFTGDKMVAQIRTDGKSQTVRNTIPKDAILSSFLVYYLLNSEKDGRTGIYVGRKEKKLVIAEEAPEKMSSSYVDVVGEEDHSGLKSFKIQNDFVTKGETKTVFTSFVASRGEILGTNDNTNGISTELVADATQATKGFTVNKSALKALFGEVPEGKINLVSKLSSNKPVPAGKQQGIPQGQGIQLKSDGPADAKDSK